MLDDWTTAPVAEPLRVTLGFLRKVTLTPDDVGPSDIVPLREAGLSDQAIVDALYVCALFNLIDRVADTFGFAVPSPEDFRRGAAMQLKMGYRV